MHGIDGFAVKLTPNNTIERIVITEDKCTENAKTTIRDKVWPEFSGMENGEKNNAIFSAPPFGTPEAVIFRTFLRPVGK